MPAAARVLDPSSHPGQVSGPGIVSVVIGGKTAAVAGDTHICALPPNAGPHSPSTITTGSKSVFIGGKPAARVGDPAGCGAVIAAGALDVNIGG
jgi:uncharacterized Zn-binding protein involved in type VI secretion